MSTRNISVTYSGYTVDGSAGRIPTGQWRIDEEGERATFEFEFIIQAASAAALAAAEDAAIDAFRTPRGDLTASLGGSTRISWSHSQSTGYDAAPYIRKIQSEWSSAVTAHFVAGVRVGRPADRLSLGYRRSSSIGVQRSPSAGSLVVTGVYTAGGGSSASANYTAGIGAYETAYLAAVGGSWERVEEATDRGETNKELVWTRRYREVLASQAPNGSPVAADVFEQDFSLSVGVSLPGDTPGLAVRPRDVSVSWRGTLSETANFETISPQIVEWIHARVAERIGPEPYAVLSETIERSPDRRGVSIQMRIIAPRQLGVLEYERRGSVRIESGTVVIPRWSGLRFAKFVAQGPARATATVEDRTLQIGEYERAASDAEIARRIGLPPVLEAATQPVLIEASETVGVREVGEGSYSLLLVDASRSATWELVAESAVVTQGSAVVQESAP